MATTNKNNAQPQQGAVPAQTSKGQVVYKAGGEDVKLNFEIVRNYLTKGNGAVSDQDLVQFISICKYNQLNPFLNEAYLVKFGQQPAQMIVSKEALFKRAEANPQYDGFRAGIIVDRNGEQVELEGCYCKPGDVLMGGWAEVYRKDRRFPIVAKVNLSEYDRKQSIWNEKRGTMICKVAKVQAMREAFPTQLGAMYIAEETRTPIDIPTVEVKDTAQRTAEMAAAAMAISRSKQKPAETAPTEQEEYHPLSLEEQKEIMDKVDMDKIPVPCDPLTGELF